LQVNAEFDTKACVNFASLEDKREEFLDISKKEFENLDPKTFVGVLVKREAKSNHFEWKFVIHNAELGAAILKLHGCRLNNKSLTRCMKKDSLFRNS
jgi:hypothetical protein